jgi:hypothetical protein
VPVDQKRAPPRAKRGKDRKPKVQSEWSHGSNPYPPSSCSREIATLLNSDDSAFSQQ